MKVNEPALLELFYSLQDMGFSLGMESYYALLESLDAGFGTRDRDALAQLCCTLWVKSEAEKQIFRKKFDQLIVKKYYDRLSNTTPKASNKLTISSEVKDSPPRKSTRKKPQLIKYTLYAASLILAIGLGIRFIGKPSSSPEASGSLVFQKSLWRSGFSFKEDQKTGSIPVERIGGDKGRLIGLIKVVDDSGYLSATVDEDFKLLTTKVYFDNRDTSTKYFKISIIDDDDIYEQNETIELQLFTIENGKLKQADTTTIVIEENITWDELLQELNEYLNILRLLTLGVLGIFVFLMYWKIRNSDTEPEGDRPSSVLPVSKLSTEVVTDMFEQIQVARAFKQPSDRTNGNYLIDTNSSPVTYRQIQQSLRYLRSFVREGVPVDLDLEQTIVQIGQNGFLLDPVLQPRPVNKTEFLLLIDRDGSMVPFHHISQALINAASRGGRFSQVRVYYFHNCPGDYLYKDPYRLEPEFIDDCLAEFVNRRIACLIFSDAGAARGQFSSKRRRETKFFLRELRQSINRVAWLNPVPRYRWKDTTAEDIAEFVPMYEFSPKEVYLAVETLRGKGQKTAPSTNI